MWASVVVRLTCGWVDRTNLALLAASPAFCSGYHLLVRSLCSLRGDGPRSGAGLPVGRLWCLPMWVSSWQTRPLKWLLPASMSPGGILVAFCFSKRLSKISKWVWPRLLSNCCLCHGSWSMWFCMHSVTVESLFSTAFWLSSIHTPLAFKASHSGGSSLCRTLELGSQMWDLDPSLPWENPHNCDYSSLFELPPASVGFDYTASPLLLPILW